MIVVIELSKTYWIPVATLVSAVGMTYHSISCLGVSDTYVPEDRSIRKARNDTMIFRHSVGNAIVMTLMLDSRANVYCSAISMQMGYRPRKRRT